MIHITQGLNDKQAQAVTLSLGSSALILAGAGSGKTRVLTHRIAYILQESDIHLTNILALTFTNKAANEMKERLEVLIGMPLGFNTWVGTFHSIAHKILRLHHTQAGLGSAFSILDASEQLTKIKRIMKEMQIDDKKFKPSSIATFISNAKDEGLRATSHFDESNIFVRIALRVFEVYERECKQSDELDFSDILLSTYELFRDNDSLRAQYINQFKHILVDEFQDTNTIQYQLITLLKDSSNTLFCVGDDDQSIYGWRGAKIENIKNLAIDIANFKTIKLEQNYRSTGTILSASNAVIANNTSRMGKRLWTDSGDGQPIDIFIGANEKAEASYIAKRISKLLDANPEEEIAILYRNNALSRTMEEALITHNIAYNIYGGLRFFDRAEIKDVLAYLRLAYNTNDNTAFTRIINLPPRGISALTVAEIFDYARLEQCSLYQALITLKEHVPTRKANAFSAFITLISSLQEHATKSTLGEHIEHIIHHSGLHAHYDKDKTDKGRNKIQNLEELVGAAHDFVNTEPDLDDTLSFITTATLDSTEASTASANVTLMTIHSAKGLEFATVYIIGVAEDIFPSMRSKDDGTLDEERRLFYVGMTRAKQKLTLSFVKSRFLYGHYFNEVPSRFIMEIPKEYLRQVHTSTSTSQNHRSQSVHTSTITIPTEKSYTQGDKVVHKKFGLGVVTNYEEGINPRVEVKFQNAGTKWLILEYAHLEKLS